MACEAGWNEKDNAEAEDGGEKLEELQLLFGGVILGLSSAFFYSQVLWYEEGNSFPSGDLYLCLPQLQ